LHGGIEAVDTQARAVDAAIAQRSTIGSVSARSISTAISAYPVINHMIDIFGDWLKHRRELKDRRPNGRC